MKNSEKSYEITFFLCLLFGVLGAHCFYAGRTRRGIAFLLTGGFLGFGVLIDIISIGTKSFRDGDGNLIGAKSQEQPAVAPPPVPAQKMKIEHIDLGDANVYGESYYKESIELLCTENHDFFMPDSELYARYLPGQRIYRYEFEKFPAAIIPEPENPFDPNALRVEIDGAHVGYIAKKETDHVREMMKAPGFAAEAHVSGGPYKLVFERRTGELAAKINDFDFGIKLKLSGCMITYPKTDIGVVEDPSQVRGSKMGGLSGFFSAASLLLILSELALVSAFVLVWLYALSPILDSWMSSAFPYVLGGGVTAGIIAFLVSSSLA